MMKEQHNENCTEITGVLVTQTHAHNEVRLDLTVTVSCPSGSTPELTASLTSPEGAVSPFAAPGLSLTVDVPQLWRPRSCGPQPLYTPTVTAEAGGRTARWQRRIGLRTAALSLEPDRCGQRFAHNINGRDIFALGAVYVPGGAPSDALRLLEDAAQANFNCIRVSGGYCPDSFYDACDRLGLMVWQDFNIPLPAEELTPAIAGDIRAQVRDAVTRLRHHPSIVLWCGNDEIERQSGSLTPRQRADYIRIFEYIIPTELRSADPSAPYWPSSPSSGGGFDDPDSPLAGDVHPKCSDLRGPGRYVSAFGTPSCPGLPAIEGFTLPRERNLFSRAMEEHSGSPRDTAHIMSNIQRYYLCPGTLSLTVYASQLAQAQIVSAAALHYRRHRGRCMGAIFRRLNDPRPGLSCSSIDSSGRWKALHYFAKRFFAPLLLSCRVEDLHSSPDAVPGKALRLCVTNDTSIPRAVLVKWALHNASCRVIKEETISLTVPPCQSAPLDDIPLPEADPFDHFVSYSLQEKSRPVSFGTALLCPPKYYPFQDPGFSCYVENDEIIVTARAFAQGIELQNAAQDLLLSDNYFDMLPGQRRVKILRGKPDSLQVRSVYDIK